MSCDSSPLTPFQPARRRRRRRRRRNTEIESITGTRDIYNIIYVYRKKEGAYSVHAVVKESKRGGKSAQAKRTFIDGTMDVRSDGGQRGRTQRESWGKDIHHHRGRMEGER